MIPAFVIGVIYEYFTETECKIKNNGWRAALCPPDTVAVISEKRLGQTGPTKIVTLWIQVSSLRVRSLRTLRQWNWEKGWQNASLPPEAFVVINGKRLGRTGLAL
jgi:hypothetical protein